VNGYWMCDIGRFNYHWIEGDDRLQRPLMRSGSGTLEPASWHDVLAGVRERVNAAGAANPEGVRFVLSAHASLEEMFVFRSLVESLMGSASPISIAWSVSDKPQPAGTKFKVPAVDAPNLNGARALGLLTNTPQDDAQGADVSALRSAVEAGNVSALYVFDPGPDGSLGDVAWIVDARASGKLPLLVVQGVLLTDLARAADFVLAGASYVEKEASYTNERGRTQATARAMAPPGDAADDWQIVVNLAAALGAPMPFRSSADIRKAMNIDVAIGEVTSAHNWLQGSNPSERWKWDFMFQDLPPVKGNVDPSSLPLPPGSIPLKEVK
jgi:predicted molibdopterin-dependent oxidoreductase YjgC